MYIYIYIICLSVSLCIRMYLHVPVCICKYIYIYKSVYTKTVLTIVVKIQHDCTTSRLVNSHAPR